MDRLEHYASAFFWLSYLPAAKGIALAMLCGLALEIIFPGERHSLMSRARGVVFYALYLVGSVVSILLLSSIVRWMGIKPVIDFDLAWAKDSGNWAIYLLAVTVLPFIGQFIGDFPYYWFHRLQHRTPLLWRFHRVHHAIEELNAVNSHHHILEDILRIPMVALPFAFIHLSLPQVAYASFLIAVSGQIIHANSRVSWGPLRYVFVEPRYHRIHHSIEPQHWDKNFAASFPVWDALFGTAYFPAKAEYPKTGLQDLPEARSLGSLLLLRRDA